MAGAWGRVQRLGAAALLALSAGAVLWHATTSPEVPFLPRDPDAPWIMVPRPVGAELQGWGRADAPVAAFAREVEIERPPERARLRARALGRLRVRVNGEPVPELSADGERWRVWREADVAPRLRGGTNRLRVQVRNPRGPALLSLRLEGLESPVASDAGFAASLDGHPLGPAIPADDTRVNPAAFAVETPARALRQVAVEVVLLFGLGAVLVSALRRLSVPRRRELPGFALGAACLGWVWLFAVPWTDIPPVVGFDVMHHRAYVDFLREHLALPVATDGWSMYHPPLFYAVAALLAPLGDTALAVLPWLGGLGSVFVAHALATRLFPDEPAVPALAVLFAATLPMNLYPSAYFSNEAPHALLVGVALVVSVDALLAERTSTLRAVGVGTAFGLAALTKFTALAVAPVALFFLAVKLVAVERAGAGRVLTRLATAAGAFGLVCGWFYARNVWLFGEPLVGNWNLPGAEQTWWQQPGFHTIAYYTGFGEALHHPYLSGFHSFWDGIYSTLWGDGGIGGRVFPEQRHPYWHWGFMSAGYLLALPVTGLLALGGALLVRDALGLPGAERARDPHRRAALSMLLTVLYTAGFSILWLTLELPFFAQAKAFYGLCAVGPLALCFAMGTARAGTWLEARAGAPGLWLVAGTVGAACGTFFLAFAA